MKLFLANIPSMLCIGGAIYLMVNSITGWGWLLLIAVIIAHSYSSN